MTQDVSDGVSDAFKTHMGTTTIVLGDVVESYEEVGLRLGIKFD